LSVDDNVDDALLLAHACKKARVSFTVTTVTNGAKAVDYLRGAVQRGEPRPDLVLLDLSMPIMTGFEVLERVRSQPELRAQPIAVFTSSANNDDVSRAYACGADYYLAKPSDIVGLQALVACIDGGLREGTAHPWPCLRAFPTFVPKPAGVV
jgi:CheY-like chemotaxis protein